MKKEFLEGLKIEGLTPEVIGQILSEHEKTVQAEKANVAAKEGELTAANQTINDLQRAVKKFDGVDIAALNQQISDLNKKYDADIKAEQLKAVNIQKEHALKDGLKEIGITDPDYLIYKHGGLDKFAFGDDLNPVGLADTVKPYKESMPHIFKQPQTFKGVQPGQGRDTIPGEAQGNYESRLAEARKQGRTDEAIRIKTEAASENIILM